jgi:hypothetical protein
LDDLDDLKEHLAANEAPKRILTVANLERAPNAKIDYQRRASYAETSV